MLRAARVGRSRRGRATPVPASSRLLRAACGQDRWRGGGCRRSWLGGAHARLLRRRPSAGCEGREGEHQCQRNACHAETGDGRDQIGRHLLHLVTQSNASCPRCGRGTNIWTCDTLSHAPAAGESTAALSHSSAPCEPRRPPLCSPLWPWSWRAGWPSPPPEATTRRRRQSPHGCHPSPGCVDALVAARSGDAQDARAVFFDGAHDGLHDLAARTAEVDRAVTADLLRAKERIEALIDSRSTSDLQTALADLADATGAAARTLDPEAATSCP